MSRGGSNLNGIPSISHKVAALSIPPVEVGAPSSKMGLGSVWSVTDPFIKNTASYLVPAYCCPYCHQYYRTVHS